MLYIFYINLLLALIAFVNSYSFRKIPKELRLILPTTVILPYRNEVKNLPNILKSLEKSLKNENLSAVLVNDQSTDGSQELTTKLVNSWDDSKRSRTKLISSSDKPEGWVGKSWANFQGFKEVSSDTQFLLFIDADIEFNEFAISSCINMMEKEELDLVSPYPKQIALTWSEKLFQPLLHWSWMTTLLLRKSEKSKRPSTVVANGQFMAVRKIAYETCGGHEKIRTQVLDDIALGRLLRRNNLNVILADGLEYITCRMYSNFSELIGGYSKSLWSSLPNLFAAFMVSVFYFATSILPVLGIILNWKYSLVSLLAIVASRYICALRFGESLISPIFQPMAILMFILLMKLSWYKKYTNKIQWKGRTI